MLSTMIMSFLFSLSINRVIIVGAKTLPVLFYPITREFFSLQPKPHKVDILLTI